jgi:peptidyl-prolyl cis-trans isomerase C
MNLIARVFDQEITINDIIGESEKICGEDNNQILQSAMNRLIDRQLLLHKAKEEGYTANDDEFECALLEVLEDLEEVPQNEEETRNLEKSIRDQIIIRKYVLQLCDREINITEEQLLAFYEDQKEVFTAPEMVKASHILIRGDEPNAQGKADLIRAQIKNASDFEGLCKEHSSCPTGARCGDLGWFSSGKMITEIEDIAFGLQPQEISEVFKTKYGYHILMVTEKKPRQILPFEELKDSLKRRLVQLEREFILIRHVKDLRSDYDAAINILDDQYSLV